MRRSMKGSRPTNPALETENRSPVRRSLLVASPQRGNHDSLRAGGSNVAIPGTPAEPSNKEAAGTQATAADLGTEVLVSENSKLKHENAELADTIKMMKRQSDVDRRNCTEMEAAAERERQRREEVERRLQTLQAESSEKDSVMSEATTLRKQLEKERQDAKAHAEALKHMEMLYKSQLEEKEEELRRASEHLESHRRSVQSEKQRARSLEEQLHGLREQYESCVQRTEAVDQGKPRRLSPPVAVTDETRRRLFSSTASNGGGTARTPASGDRAGQYFDSFPAPPPPTATQVGSPTAEATRGRALTTAARSQPAPAPAMVGQFQQQQHQQQQQQQQQDLRGRSWRVPQRPSRGMATGYGAARRAQRPPSKGAYLSHRAGPQQLPATASAPTLLAGALLKEPVEVGWMPAGYYVGWVKDVNECSWVSIVACPYLHHAQDVYVHHSVAEPGALHVGDLVAFAVHVNDLGRPQASAPFWKLVGVEWKSGAINFGHFQGLVKYYPNTGCGFAENDDVRRIHHRDAFIHQHVIRRYGLNSDNLLAFDVHLSSTRGTPQVSLPCWACCSATYRMPGMHSGTDPGARRRLGWK